MRGNEKEAIANLIREASESVALSPDESLLLAGYRQLDSRGRAGLLAYLAGANADDGGTMNFHGSVGKVIKGNVTIGTINKTGRMK